MNTDRREEMFYFFLIFHNNFYPCSSSSICVHTALAGCARVCVKFFLFYSGFDRKVGGLPGCEAAQQGIDLLETMVS
jgi:hypothetical protein